MKFDFGELEAFHTAGGLSTMAFSYESKVPTMEYKTLLPPGHAETDGLTYARFGSAR